MLAFPAREHHHLTEKLSRHIFRRGLHPEFQWFNPFVTAPVLGKYAHSFYTIYPVWPLTTVFIRISAQTRISAHPKGRKS